MTSALDNLVNKLLTNKTADRASLLLETIMPFNNFIQEKQRNKYEEDKAKSFQKSFQKTMPIVK